MRTLCGMHKQLTVLYFVVFLLSSAVPGLGSFLHESLHLVRRWAPLQKTQLALHHDHFYIETTVPGASRRTGQQRAHLCLVWVHTPQVPHVTLVADDRHRRLGLRMVPKFLQPPLAVLKRNCTHAWPSPSPSPSPSPHGHTRWRHHLHHLACLHRRPHSPAASERQDKRAVADQ